MIRLPRTCRGRAAVRFPANSSHMCCVELELELELLDILLFTHLVNKGFCDAGLPRSLTQRLCHAGGPNKGEKAVCGCTAPEIFARWHLAIAITSVFSVIVI